MKEDQLADLLRTLDSAPPDDAFELQVMTKLQGNSAPRWHTIILLLACTCAAAVVLVLFPFTQLQPLLSQLINMPWIAVALAAVPCALSFTLARALTDP